MDKKDSGDVGVPMHRYKAPPEGKDISGKADFDVKRDVTSTEEAAREGKVPPVKESVNEGKQTEGAKTSFGRFPTPVKKDEVKAERPLLPEEINAEAQASVVEDDQTAPPHPEGEGYDEGTEYEAVIESWNTASASITHPGKGTVHFNPDNWAEGHVSTWQDSLKGRKVRYRYVVGPPAHMADVRVIG